MCRMVGRICVIQTPKLINDQTEGGGGSGSFCTNSMGKLNFLISIDKKMQIFINSFTYCLKFGTKMKYLIWFVSLKHLDLNINLLP